MHVDSGKEMHFRWDLTCVQNLAFWPNPLDEETIIARQAANNPIPTGELGSCYVGRMGDLCNEDAQVVWDFTQHVDENPTKAMLRVKWPRLVLIKNVTVKRGHATRIR